MKPAWWMVGAAIGSWLAIAAVPGIESDVELLFGMIAPLAGARGHVGAGDPHLRARVRNS